MGTQTGGLRGDALDEVRRTLRAARSRAAEARSLCERARNDAEQRLIDTETRISKVALRRARLAELDREAGAAVESGQP